VGFASDSDLQSLLDTAEGLNFKVDLVPRGVNKHFKGQLSPSEYDQIRSILPDYAEFIIPVFWSRTEFVGSPAIAGATSLDLARQGLTDIATAAVREGQSAPRPAFAGPGYEPYEDWAYLRNSVATCAEQSPGVRRQGFLAICRQSVSVVSLNVDFQPSLDQVNTWGASPGQLRDPYWQYGALLQIQPPEYGDIVVEKTVAYKDMESLKIFELARFDGLALFLRAGTVLSLNGDRSFQKWQRSVEERVSTSPAPIRAIQKLKMWKNENRFQLQNGFYDLFQDLYDLCIGYGANVASGPGVDLEKERTNLQLFSSALGVAIESADNGSKIFVESPFQELDTAVELITANQAAGQSESKSTSAAMSGGGAQRDLAAELEKLASLRQSGILTEEEFVAAKAAVINSI